MKIMAIANELNKIIERSNGFDVIYFRVKFHKPEMKEIYLPVDGLYIGSLNIKEISSDDIISIIGPVNENEK